MRLRTQLVNPQGGKPVQLVCRSNFSYKIITEEIIDSTINENGDKVICFIQDNKKVWINEKDNLIIDSTHYNVNNDRVNSYLHPIKPIDNNFNRIPSYRNTPERSRKAVEARNSIRLSKTAQIKLECSVGSYIAYRFGNSLLAKQTSVYGLRVKKVTNKNQQELIIK